MRPIYLKMSAFGPYAGEIDVPMHELGAKGLYLITGDTGAGKTTLFDAICFALFGAPSGCNRDTNQFRSKYAKDDVETKVELTFNHNGKEYRVERNPEHYRLSKRGNDIKKYAADATLYLPDGQVVYKIKDVNSKIEDILGINRDQFSQIAMLAQGDFLKLLLADTKHRQEIFRKLFSTEYYKKLEFELDEARKKVYGEAEKGKLSIKQYVDDISVDENDVLLIEVEKAKNNQMTMEDILSLLNTLIDQDTELKEMLSKELKQINKELETVNGKIGIAESLVKTKNDLNEAKEYLKRLEPEEAILKNKEIETKNNLVNRDRLTQDAAKIQAELCNYDAVEELIHTINNDNNALTADELLLTQEEKEYNAKKTEVDLLTEEQKQYKDLGADVEKKTAELIANKKELVNLEELSDSYKIYKKELNILSKLQEEYSRDNEQFIKLQHEYEIMDQSFRDGQAGILASSLTDGMKCPVCGSTTHPQKAKLTEAVPSEKELKESKELAEKARNKANESSTKAGNKKTETEVKGEEIKRNANKILNNPDMDNLEFLIEGCYNSLTEKINALTKEIASLNKKVKRSKEIEKLIPETTNEIERIIFNVTELKTRNAANKGKIVENKKQLENMRAKLMFGCKADAENQMNSLSEAAGKIQSDYEKAAKEYKEKSEEIVAVKSKIESLNESLSEADNINLLTEKEKKTVLDKRQEFNTCNSQKVVSRLETNTGIKLSIEKVSEKLADTEKKLQWITALSDTANGKISGKEKIALETYIQTTYFDRIIRRANLRFLKMSNGQYELKRQQEATSVRGQSGLELSVIDHYNGSERGIKTLSGGESFIASLSLALGLSDEVQSSAGGIQIDTMFVDEGFGSLDPETLDMAYKSLSGLTEGNKLVGIISHVSYLKEKIDKQIVVTKEKSGGSFVKVTG